MYIEDNMIEDRVRELGGRTKDVDLRFSIEWNECLLLDNNDLDAWCVEPSGEIIRFSHKRSSKTCGYLDVDITNPATYYKSAVENITYENTNQMIPGDYEFKVHTYAYRKGHSGFRAELLMNGKKYKFDHFKPVSRSGLVTVVVVNFNGRNLRIKHLNDDIKV